MSLEVFSLAQILFIVQATAIHCSVFLFSPFFYFSSLWNLKIWFNQSLVFYCFLFLLSILFIHLFFSTLLSVPCCCFLSNLLSFLFSFPIMLLSLLLPYALLLFTLFSFCYSSSFLSPLSNTYLLSLLLLLLFSLNTFFFW